MGDAGLSAEVSVSLVMVLPCMNAESFNNETINYTTQCSFLSWKSKLLSVK